MPSTNPRLPARPSAAPPAGSSADPSAHADQYPVVQQSDEYVGLYQPASGSGPVSAVPPRPAVARPGVPQRAVPDGIWPDPMWERSRPAPAATEESVVDLGQLREIVSFPWRAVRRRRRLAGWVFAAVLGAALFTVLVSPRQYDVETTILAQRNFVMPALGNPRRAVPVESDAPTRMATEAVINRDNLLSIIEELGLEGAWPRLRTPLGRAKDALRRRIKGPQSAEDRRERLVNLLLSRVWVTSDEGTVHIGTHFPDPWLAFRLVQVAQRNFLEKRHQSELALIRESIGILQAHVDSAHDQIETALADVRTFTPPAARRSVASPYAADGFGGGASRVRRDPGLAALESDLGAKRAALVDAESARAQRLGALQARLAELRRTLGPAHPEVVSTQQALESLGTEPTEFSALRAAARDAETKVVAAGGSTRGAAGQSGDAGTANLASVALARLAAPSADTLEDPRLTYARSRLKIAVADYEDLLDRLEGARIELETARASFKYRYSIIAPPQYPQRLAKPNIPMLFVGGVFAAAALATFAALATELGSGRVVEGWQVSRFVGLPVLGETPPA